MNNRQDMEFEGILLVDKPRESPPMMWSIDCAEN